MQELVWSLHLHITVHTIQHRTVINVLHILQSTVIAQTLSTRGTE